MPWTLWSCCKTHHTLVQLRGGEYQNADAMQMLSNCWAPSRVQTRRAAQWSPALCPTRHPAIDGSHETKGMTHLKPCHLCLLCNSEYCKIQTCFSTIPLCVQLQFHWSRYVLPLHIKDGWGGGINKSCTTTNTSDITDKWVKKQPAGRFWQSMHITVQANYWRIGKRRSVYQHLSLRVCPHRPPLFHEKQWQHGKEERGGERQQRGWR